MKLLHFVQHRKIDIGILPQEFEMLHARLEEMQTSLKHLEVERHWEFRDWKAENLITSEEGSAWGWSTNVKSINICSPKQ